MHAGSFLIRMYILESLDMCLSYGCVGMCVYIPWQHFANMGSPAQMTTTSRTASNLCERTWSACPEICVPRPKILAQLGNRRTLAGMSTRIHFGSPTNYRPEMGLNYISMIQPTNKYVLPSTEIITSWIWKIYPVSRHC